ncbi:hypothetical protein K501DRAFT_269823 [Backusella circina FSU 941]|nr:hypothetical protein K501DRAFT_269823 [Backusella circina FSU 941]
MTPSNVKTLSFYFVILPEGYNTYVSKYFPLLTELKLKKCQMYGRKLDLSPIKLYNLSYSVGLSEGKVVHKVLVSMLNNGEKRLYHVEPKKMHLQMNAEFKGLSLPKWSSYFFEMASSMIVN